MPATPSADLDVVKAFYSTLLSKPTTVTLDDVYAVFAKDADSIPTPPMGPGPEGIFKTLKYFGQVVPDLQWVPDEILQDGNRYTVRSTFTGTPVGPFLTVEQPTGKSFQAMSIDVLVVENGRVQTTYHLEDWMSVIGQLTTA